jgi:hypothetical protein
MGFIAGYFNFVLVHKIIWSTTSNDSLFRSCVTISPADEKIFSEGTDVAGTNNTCFAITDNRGYLVESDLSSR